MTLLVKNSLAGQPLLLKEREGLVNGVTSVCPLVRYTHSIESHDSLNVRVR